MPLEPLGCIATPVRNSKMHMHTVTWDCNAAWPCFTAFDISNVRVRASQYANAIALPTCKNAVFSNI